MTLLPVDSNDNVIPALALKPDGAKTVSAMTSISTRNATPFDSATRVLSLYADVPVYIRFGEANVEAGSSDHYFPANVYYDFSIRGNGSDHTPYVAVLAAEENGTVYISEKR